MYRDKYVAMLTSAGWGEPLYASTGPDEATVEGLLTNDFRNAYRFDNAAAAKAEGRELANHEGIMRDAGGNAVFFSAVRVA